MVERDAGDPRREKPGFAGLLRLLDGIEGIDRIRYTSPHPKDMREDVIRAHAELGSVCEHIHLPLQSGSSRLLKAMALLAPDADNLLRIALAVGFGSVSAFTRAFVQYTGETPGAYRRRVTASKYAA